MTDNNSGTKSINQYEGTAMSNSIKQAFADFIKENGREPNVHEIEKDPRFPSVRTIQRRFGGLKQLRRDLGLSIENFCAGEERRKTVIEINKRGFEVEQATYRFLLEQYPIEMVHRQYMYCDDARTKADFCVWNRVPRHRDIIDVFFPSTLANLTGCVNSKQAKHSTMEQHFVEGYTFEVWLVCSNPEITTEQIRTFVGKKKKKLMPFVNVLSFEDFKEVFKS